MKKIIPFVLFLFMISFSKGQSDLTLVISETVGKGYFKQESYNWTIQGIKNSSESAKFLAGIKKDNNIKSVTLTKDGKSTDYAFSITVHKIYGKKYFVKLLKANGVTKALVNGKSESLDEGKSTD